WQVDGSASLVEMHFQDKLELSKHAGTCKMCSGLSQKRKHEHFRTRHRHRRRGSCRRQGQRGRAIYSPSPAHMMLGLSSPDERIVAVLHDVCEDCPGWTFDRLRA